MRSAKYATVVSVAVATQRVRLRALKLSYPFNAPPAITLNMSALCCQCTCAYDMILTLSGSERSAFVVETQSVCCKFSSDCSYADDPVIQLL